MINDITLCFKSVDSNNDGLINNIEFFVMMRALEEKWRRQGLVRPPTPDRELNTLYSIYNDFNSTHKGVTLEEFIECRDMI